MAATYLVSELINRVHRTLQDGTLDSLSGSSGGIRWDRTELLRWLNDAYLEVVRRRPEACTYRGLLGINAGDAFFDIRATGEGAIATYARRAIRITNVFRAKVANNDGSTYPGSDGWNAVRLIDKSVLDDQFPDWPSRIYSTLNDQARYWVFDPRMPTVLSLFPRPVGDAAGSGAFTQVEIMFAYAPLEHPAGDAAETSTARISLDSNLFVNPLIDYVLYRAYQKDAEYAANLPRSESHYAAFQNALAFTTEEQQNEYDRLIDPVDMPTQINPHQPT